MTDSNQQQEPQSVADKVKAFFVNKNVQTTIQVAFAMGGPAYLFLSGKLGLDGQQIGLVYQAVIMFAPGVIVWLIQMAQRTHTAIVLEAARILAARQAGGVVITDPGKAPAAVVAAANNPNVPGINPAANENPPSPQAPDKAKAA